MPSAYTPSLKLILQATGENSGNWGNLTNTDFTSLIELAVAGYESISMVDADRTLTNGDGSTANEARYAFINMASSVALTVARNVIVPTASKLYFFKNATTGGFAVTLKTSAGIGISVPSGKSMVLMCDGTNVIDAVTSFSSLALATALPVTSGGTGVTTSTGSGSNVLSTSPTLVTPALGTPSALVGTNITGTAAGLSIGGNAATATTATTVTTNANLTGAVTSVGNAASLGSFTSAQLATALTDETGTGANVFATSPTLVTPALGTPSAIVLTNATSVPVNQATGTLAVANGGTGVTTSTGTGSNVLSASPTFTGTATASTVTATTVNSTFLTVTSDSSFNGVVVGRGAGSIGTNIRVGPASLQSNTTGSSNVAVGYGTLNSNLTGAGNTAVGYSALNANTASGNTAVGQAALSYNTSGTDCVAIGAGALNYSTTAIRCIAIGSSALSTSSGVNTGDYNVAIGYHALINTTGGGNVAIGEQGGVAMTTGSGNTILNPSNATGGLAPIFAPTTENNRFCMGSTAVTNAYIQVAWTVVSDARDKTNFASIPHGLDFVNQLQPTSFQFRKSREDETPTGPVRYGFKAQDVLALEGSNPVVVDAEDSEKLRFNESSLIPILVKAIQELTARIAVLEAK